MLGFETKSVSVEPCYRPSHMPYLQELKRMVTIPNQNKNICTACDVTVWVHSTSGLLIKWCKGCKNFKSWASFGSKGHLTRCLQCRDQQKKLRAKKKAGNHESICEQLYADRKHTLIFQPECLVDPGPVDAKLEAEIVRIE